MNSNEQTDDRSKIPEILKVGDISTDSENMSFDTLVHDPVIQSDTFVRFVLTNQGILHSFSKITFGYDAGGGQGTCPANIGIYSLIQRATLKIGTSTICEIDDFNHYMGYKSPFIHNPINYERETYTSSRVMDRQILFDDTKGSESNVNASGYGMKGYLEYQMEEDGEDGNLDAIQQIKLTNKPVFSISLAELFPMLRANELPLYLISEQVSIELHLVAPTSGLRHIFDKEAGESTGTTINIDKTQTKLIADYLYYTDGNVMADFEAKNKSVPIQYNYPDFRLNKRSLTKDQLETEQIIDIGGAGRVVRKVICALENTGTPGDSAINSRFHSYCPTPDASGNKQLFVTNALFNDRRLYPVDRSNPSVHYHDLNRTEGLFSQAYITKSEFSKEDDDPGGIVSNYSYLGFIQKDSNEGILGRSFYYNYDTDMFNERINSRGIQLQFNYNSMLTGDYVHRSWVELEKTATLLNGRFSTELA